MLKAAASNLIFLLRLRNSLSYAGKPGECASSIRTVISLRRAIFLRKLRARSMTPASPDPAIHAHRESWPWLWCHSLRNRSQIENACPPSRAGELIIVGETAKSFQRNQLALDSNGQRGSWKCVFLDRALKRSRTARRRPNLVFRMQRRERSRKSRVAEASLCSSPVYSKVLTAEWTGTIRDSPTGSTSRAREILPTPRLGQDDAGSMFNDGQSRNNCHHRVNPLTQFCDVIIDKARLQLTCRERCLTI